MGPAFRSSQSNEVNNGQQKTEFIRGTKTEIVQVECDHREERLKRESSV